MFASAWSTRWATQVTIPSSVWLSDLTGIMWSGLGLILRAADRRTGGHGRLTYLYLIMMMVVVDCCAMMKKAKKFALPFTIIIINNKTASSAYLDAKSMGKEEHDEEV